MNSFPDFGSFFRELNEGFDPYPWQTELAERVRNSDWPEYIAVPTGSGKTACLEIAIYALAAQAALSPEDRTASRRIFFIVNRRVIVDEAFRRAARMAAALAAPKPDQPACLAIANALRLLNPLHSLLRKSEPAAPPLDCVQLRGAIFQDQRWARSLLQPTIVATTLDQIGSRMLFRGYGVSPRQASIHAALVSTDALWLLDEAHISRPFVETITAIQRFRETHSKKNPKATKLPPLNWVQLTATPPIGRSDRLELSTRDLNHPHLSKKLEARKRANLVIGLKPSSKGKALEATANALLEEALVLLGETRPKSLLIMVNRVLTARLVYDLLKKAKESRKPRFRGNLTLLIGRMRPYDRDRETERLQSALKVASCRDLDPQENDDHFVEIVVATQCLEVGADLDFDGLITECASLDSLRQRFGRLNRGGRDIAARASIIMPFDSIEREDKKLKKLSAEGRFLDPIYGNAIAATWNWLESIAEDGTVDFGLNTFSKKMETLSESMLEQLQAPVSNAPVLLPSYLDAWAQTSPPPWPDPDPSPFIHGAQEHQPDVLVCWRTDLSLEDSLDEMKQAVSLCPPSQIETLPVPIAVFSRWFFESNARSSTDDDTGDLLTSVQEIKNDPIDVVAPRCKALLWRGISDSTLLERPDQIRPGVTLVLSASAQGWKEMGYVPEESLAGDELRKIDIAEESFLRRRDKAILRLHPLLLAEDFWKNERWNRLMEWIEDPDIEMKPSELLGYLNELLNDEPDLLPKVRESLKLLVDRKHGVRYERYINGKGIVLTTRRRVGQFSVILEGDDETDNLSTADRNVTLVDHTDHVLDIVRKSAETLGITEHLEALTAAAMMHDWGKLDPRFQAILSGGNPYIAFALQNPLAKSERPFSSYFAYRAAQKRSGLPDGFRHEFASLQLAELPEAATYLPKSPIERELALYLIGSHHGYGRPFAPVVDDAEPPKLETKNITNPSLELGSELRANRGPHKLDSGISRRFWQLLQHHGWWDLAYLEALLRLADQQASEAEAQGIYDNCKEEDQDDDARKKSTAFARS